MATLIHHQGSGKGEDASSIRPQRSLGFLFMIVAMQFLFNSQRMRLAEYLLYKVDESVRVKQMEQCGESWDRR
jgi:hypothetical protein